LPDFWSFFVESDKIQKNHFTLNKKESHHLSNVLRIKAGELVWLIDGVGTTYNGIIENILPEKVTGTIKEVFTKYGEPTCDIFLAIGIIKRAWMELAIEKATECGVGTITAVPMERSIKRSINYERVNKIIRSATKQCARSKFPSFMNATSLQSWMDQLYDGPLVVCSAGATDHIGKLYSILPKNLKGLNLVIGPEGDLTDKEVSLLKDNKAIFVSRGNRRLRTETAVISALSIINEIVFRNGLSNG
jgi:16S rRNA (uracil1498-N3)-methyltransferase